MIKIELKKQIYSLAGIVLFAFLINLGSAWDDLGARLGKPMFVKMIIGTIGLLYAYLFLVQGIYKQLNKTDSWYVKQKEYVKSLFFILLSTAVIVFIHLFVVDFLLAQRNHKSVFTEHYFNSDFWFFFIPLLLYIIALYFNPKIRLLQVSKVPILPQTSLDELVKEEVVTAEPVGPELKVGGVFEAKLHPSIDQNHELIVAWRESGDVEFLFDYFQMLINENEWHLEGNVPLYKAVILNKTNIMSYAYFANGEKWALHHIDDAIFDNPWLIKLSSDYHLNMLYAPLSLRQKMVIKGNTNKPKSPNKLNEVDVIGLHEDVKNIFLQTMKNDKLHTMLILSRRMSKHYHNFYKLSELKKLDVNRLGDDFGRIE